MRIPALIVGGFLGSGKTTFIIKSILTRLKGKKVAVLVNDFGQINYDKIRLYQENMEVYGVEGGCFCCELGGEFLNTLAKLKDKKLDMLIVETSGVSNPSPIYYSLETSGFSVELIIGVFGLDLEEDILSKPLVQAQIEASHCLILTKADMLKNGQIKRKLSFFSSYQKPIFLATEGWVEEDLEKLFGVVREAPKGKEGHGSFQSWIVKPKGFFSRSDLEDFLLKLPKSIYRVKGIVQCLESPIPMGLNYSFGYITWEKVETQQEPFLVFIGEKVDRSIFESFPEGTFLSLEHERVCFPLGEFNAREGIAYLDGTAMDELEVAERLLEELENGDFLFISAEDLNFRNFEDIKAIIEKCESSEFEKVVFWRMPSCVVSYILEKLSEKKIFYHLSEHYLLPKAHISLRVDTPAKRETLLSFMRL